MQNTAISIEQESVCAWCRSEYDTKTGERLRKLTNAEYDRIKSHGICNECATREKARFSNSRSITSSVQ